MCACLSGSIATPHTFVKRPQHLRADNAIQIAVRVVPMHTHPIARSGVMPVGYAFSGASVWVLHLALTACSQAEWSGCRYLLC